MMSPRKYLSEVLCVARLRTMGGRTLQHVQQSAGICEPKFGVSVLQAFQKAFYVRLALLEGTVYPSCGNSHARAHAVWRGYALPEKQPSQALMFSATCGISTYE